MLHKTAVATAASIAVVVIAGATAVGANIGILDSSDDDAFGQLSAVSVPSTTAPPELLSTAATPPPTTAGPELTTFDVEGIAAVTVARDGDTLTVVAVEPQPGWTWSVERDDGEVEVELQSASEEVDVYLSVLDGQVQTRIERSALPSATTQPPVVGATSSGYDDDHEDDDRYDDDYEDDDHDDHEDDDHEDEYEGRDDDD